MIKYYGKGLTNEQIDEILKINVEITGAELEQFIIQNYEILNYEFIMKFLTSFTKK